MASMADLSIQGKTLDHVGVIRVAGLRHRLFRRLLRLAGLDPGLAAPWAPDERGADGQRRHATRPRRRWPRARGVGAPISSRARPRRAGGRVSGRRPGTAIGRRPAPAPSRSDATGPWPSPSRTIVSKVAGDRAVEPARRNRLLSGDLAEQLLVVAALEGGAQGQQLVEGHAQGVDVGPLIDIDPLRRAKGLLGAHSTGACRPHRLCP